MAISNVNCDSKCSFPSRLRQHKNSFRIYHGPIYLGFYFGAGVLMPIKEFLDANPTETVIISYQREDDPIDSTESFEQTLQRDIENHLPDRAYTGDTVPTLGSVRNKVRLVF